MRRRHIAPILLAAAVSPLVTAPHAGSSAPERKTVQVGDNFFAPSRLTVQTGARVTWKWPDDVAGDVHDVKLRSGPKGVRKFQSEPASVGYRYRRTLRKPGTYRIVCTFHSREMKMTIKVRG